MCITYSINEIVQLTGVSRPVVMKWIKAELLPSYSIPTTTRRRVKREDLVLFLQQNGMPELEDDGTHNHDEQQENDYVENAGSI